MNWNCISLIAMTSELVFNTGGFARPLIVIRSHNAKTLRLRVDPRDASVRLTMPARGSLCRAIAWVGQQRAWIEAELKNCQWLIRLHLA